METLALAVAQVLARGPGMSCVACRTMYPCVAHTSKSGEEDVSTSLVVVVVVFINGFLLLLPSQGIDSGQRERPGKVARFGTTEWSQT